MGQAAYPVAHGGCTLELQRLGGALHLGGEVLLHLCGLAGQEGAGLRHQLGVVGRVDAPDAGGAAAAYLVQQTGPGAVCEHRVGRRSAAGTPSALRSPVWLTAQADANGPQ